MAVLPLLELSASVGGCCHSTVTKHATAYMQQQQQSGSWLQQVAEVLWACCYRLRRQASATVCVTGGVGHKRHQQQQ